LFGGGREGSEVKVGGGVDGDEGGRHGGGGKRGDSVCLSGLFLSVCLLFRCFSGDDRELVSISSRI
jgi:hypothetical protein